MHAVFAFFPFSHELMHISNTTIFGVCFPQGGNHFDQYEEGQLEVEQASLDKPIESVRPHLSSRTIGPAVRVDDWSREE